MLERPLQDGVVLAGQDLDVDGHVGTLAAAVPVEEQGRLQLVAALKCKKKCLLDYYSFNFVGFIIINPIDKPKLKLNVLNSHL